MFTSSADVFGLRQAVSDLRAYLRESGRPVRARLASSMRENGRPGSRLARLDQVIDAQGARFVMPADEDVHEVCRLAAALPSDDYPAFTFSTALLLADRLQENGGQDDLYWNWDSFCAEYALADPSVRSALMNGFRFGALAGRVQIDDPPSDKDCLTCPRAEVESALREAGLPDLARFVADEPTAEDAGAAWRERAGGALTGAEAKAFRYLYERPVSLRPGRAGDTPLLPWVAA